MQKKTSGFRGFSGRAKAKTRVSRIDTKYTIEAIRRLGAKIDETCFLKPLIRIRVAECGKWPTPEKAGRKQVEKVPQRVENRKSNNFAVFVSKNPNYCSHKF